MSIISPCAIAYCSVMRRWSPFRPSRLPSALDGHAGLSCRLKASSRQSVPARLNHLAMQFTPGKATSGIRGCQ